MVPLTGSEGLHTSHGDSEVCQHLDRPWSDKFIEGITRVTTLLPEIPTYHLFGHSFEYHFERSFYYFSCCSLVI